MFHLDSAECCFTCTTWTTVDTGTHKFFLQIHGIDGTSVIFRSQFFAVSGFQLVLIPPEALDFSSIILQFDEKLADSHTVLSVDSTLFCLYIIFLIILRQFDRKDARKVMIILRCKITEL